MLFQVPIDLNKLELKNPRIHVLASAPGSPVTGQLYYDSGTNKLMWWNGSVWVDATGGTVPDATTGSKGIVQLAGDLAGTAALPVVANSVITDAKVAPANKDGAAGTPSMRTLGLTATTAAAGNDTRLSDSRAPNGSAGGDLSGSYPNPQIATGVIVDGDVNTLNKDGLAATPSMRTLGLGSVQAMPGNTALNAITAPAADLAMNNKKITGLADAASATDAVTKQQLDAMTTGLEIKQSVRAASTANIAIPPGGTTLTVDGVALANTNRVLLKNQSTPSQNGIYIVAGVGTSVTLTRSGDADSSVEVTAGMFTFVEEGTTQADTGWVLTTDNPIVLATTALAFAQFSGAGSIGDGAALLRNGNVLDVVVNTGGTGGLEIQADALQIKPLGVTNAMIAATTIDLTAKVTGALPVANGGTGQTAQKAARETGLAAAGYYSSATHGAGTTITITQATHGLRASRGLLVQVRLESDGTEQIVDTAVAANGDVTVTFAVSQSANTYRVTIIG